MACGHERPRIDALIRLKSHGDVRSNGEPVRMFESGAIVAFLADGFQPGAFTPLPGVEKARADYEMMLHFAANWMDSMLWQMELHLILLPEADRDPRTAERYQAKWDEQVVPQLVERLTKQPYMCGDRFTAADIIVGFNIRWGTMWDLDVHPVLEKYLDRLKQRPAYQEAYSDAHEFGQ